MAKTIIARLGAPFVKLWRTTPLNRKLLTGLLLILAIILAGRTTSYLSEQVVETSDAHLYQTASPWAKATSKLAQKTRLHILKKQYHWLYVKTNQGQTGWLPDWQMWRTRRNHITSLRQATIVIDPGHGGSDSGALSANQKAEEKHYTLIFARALVKQLRAHHARVYLTRNSDKSVSLKARPRLAEKVHADVFISIHFNSSTLANTASGVTTYYYHKKTGSKHLAQTIASQFNHLQLGNRGVEFGDFLVIRNNTVPAVLLELGYINNNYDLRRINRTSYQKQCARQITKALQNYFK